MMNKVVFTETQGDVAIVTLNDGKANVLNDLSLTQLSQELDEAGESKAIILTGAGKCFSGGLDLKVLPTLNPVELRALLEKFSKVLQKILRSSVPVIAAVNGHCIAGGAVMTLCCDYSFGVDEDLKIGLSEVAVGMPLPVLVVELARQRLDPRRLAEAVLFGKLFAVREAVEVGFLHRVTPKDGLLEETLQVAHQLATLPSQAYARTKTALWKDLPKELGAEAIESFLTEKAREHMSQFSESKQGS